MRIKVHVQGIKGSGSIKKGEEPNVLFNGILEIDGHLFDEVASIEVVFKGGEIATVKPHLMPGSFEVVTHTDESWPELIRRLTEVRNLQYGDGRSVFSEH